MSQRPLQLKIWVMVLIAMLLASMGAGMGGQSVYAAGNAVYYDDFEDGNVHGWTVSKGQWVVTSDGDTQVYKQTGNTAGTEGFVTVGDASWTDYTVEAKVKAISSVGTGPSSGLMLRVKNNDNFYLFRLNWAVKSAQLLKRTNGTYSTLTSELLSSPDIVDGQWYDLKVEAYNNVIEGYVNGVKVISYTDNASPILNGAAGFRSYGQVVEVDDYSIRPQRLSGTLIDDFEDGNANGWTVAKGQWAVASDGSKVYKQTSTSATAEGFVTVGNTNWADYTVETKIKAISRGGAGDAAGLIFRVKNNNNLYLFRLHWDLNTAQLMKRTEGTYSILASAPLSFPDVQYGQWYDLKVNVYHNVIEGYVNGTKVLSYTDGNAPILSGAAGFRSYAQVVEFDDYAVSLWDRAILNSENVTVGGLTPISGGDQAQTAVTVNTTDPASFESKDIQFSASAGGVSIPVTPAAVTLHANLFQAGQAGYSVVIPLTLDTSVQDGSAPVSVIASVYGQTAYRLYAPVSRQNVPAVPTGLQASFLSKTYLTLVWNNAERASQYRVYQSEQLGGPYTAVSTVTSTTYTAKGLSKDTAYYYKVSALNVAGESPLSAPISLRTHAESYAPPIPSGYTLAFEDTFDNSPLDTDVWNYRITEATNSVEQAANVSVANGNAVIEVRKEAVNGKAYTGGGIITKQGFGYGYYETRAKYAVYKGWHPAFWTSIWDGSEPRPILDGVRRIEIDINEFEISSAATTYENNLYEWGPNQKSNKRKVPMPPDLQQEYHVWGAEYTADYVKYYLDGQLTNTINSTGYAFNPQHVWLSVISKATVDESKLPGAVYVDYFRYYSADTD